MVTVTLREVVSLLTGGLWLAQALSISHGAGGGGQPVAQSLLSPDDKPNARVAQCSNKWFSSKLTVHEKSRCSKELWKEYNRTQAIEHCTLDMHCSGLMWHPAHNTSFLESDEGTYAGCGGKIGTRPSLVWHTIEKPMSCEEETAKCADCDVVVDLRCLHAGPWRHAFYHRIVDCLVPLYGLIEKASVATTGKRCTLSYFDDLYEVDLQPFFGSLWDTYNFRQIDEDARCVQTLPYYAALPTISHGKLWRAKHISDPLLLEDIGVDLQRNVGLLQADVRRYLLELGDFNFTDRPIMFVKRRGTRELTKQAEKDLLKGLKKTQSRVVTYAGHESLVDTFRLFGTAKGIIGYHGAGFANAMFTLKSACVGELSTYLDLKSETPWRTNNRIAEMNNNLNWKIHYLPLQQMLEVNGLDTTDDSTVTDKLIKDLPFVSLTGGQIRKIVSHAVACS